MSEAPAPRIAPLAVAEFERRLKWRAGPTLVFIMVLALLLGAAVWPVVFPPPLLAGLPDDPDVFAAAAALRGRIALPEVELRFESSLTGPVAPGVRVAPDADMRISRAEALLVAAKSRLDGDPRWSVAFAAVDLVRHRYPAAERRYREALERSANYPEARLGLGVALALAAEVERHPLTRQRRRLQAIAQFASVPPAAPEYGEALYDRAVLLDRVGRRGEAARFANAWIARDGGGPGEERMRGIAAGGP